MCELGGQVGVELRKAKGKQKGTQLVSTAGSGRGVLPFLLRQARVGPGGLVYHVLNRAVGHRDLDEALPSRRLRLPPLRGQAVKRLKAGEPPANRFFLTNMLVLV